jgi:glycerol-3-phosphate dehydrogenase
VPQLTELTKIMTFFADDGRLFFAIPMESRTCIGTTDTPQKNWASEATQDDIEFILDNINAQMRLRKPLTKEDVIATRCGVRPLAVSKGTKNQGDWMKLSRKHVTEFDQDRKYISIYGGKLTDCVNVGNELRAICEQLGYHSEKQPWYGEDEGKDAFLAKATRLKKECLDGVDNSAGRLWRRYGKEAGELLSMIDDEPDLANEVITGTGVLRAEVKYAADHEMVVTMEDFLRRRTNLSLCHRLSEANSEMSEIAEMLFGQDGGDRLREYQQAQ